MNTLIYESPVPTILPTDLARQGVCFIRFGPLPLRAAIDLGPRFVAIARAQRELSGDTAESPRRLAPSLASARNVCRWAQGVQER
jgi:hypothetical protein